MEEIFEDLREDLMSIKKAIGIVIELDFDIEDESCSHGIYFPSLISWMKRSSRSWPQMSPAIQTTVLQASLDMTALRPMSVTLGPAEASSSGPRRSRLPRSREILSWSSNGSHNQRTLRLTAGGGLPSLAAGGLGWGPLLVTPAAFTWAPCLWIAAVSMSMMLAPASPRGLPEPWANYNDLRRGDRRLGKFGLL